MRKSVLYIFAVLVVLSACRKSDYELSEDELQIVAANAGGVGTTTWTSDKEYLLDGFVFVNPGQTLIIEPGTVIRAKTGQGLNASALVVARGGKIFAQGTKNEPIIFTCEGDDLEGSIDVYTRGLWGGVIILGNAPVNTTSGEAYIEGIPLSEPRGVYGGDNDADNSGVLEYVSIRHGGTDIGTDNEINGLTLGGVGKGTRISHIEVISNKDDGIELFGGTVNLKYISVAFCGDDAFDFDLGYHGKCQFLLAIQGEQVGDCLAEHDGGVSPEDGIPYTIPEIYNATFIGSGQSLIHNLITFQDNGGGIYSNSIFVNQDLGITVEYVGDVSSYERLETGDVTFNKNIFYHVAENTFESLGKVVDQSFNEIQDKSDVLILDLISEGNEIENYGIGYSGSTFKISSDSIPDTNLYTYTSDWYDWVDYKGAFGPEENWIESWTLLSQEGLAE